MMSLALGTASVALIGLNVPAAVTSQDPYAPAWSIGVAVGLGVPTLTLAFLFSVLPIRALRGLFAVYSTTMILALAVLPLALRADAIPVSETPWIYNIVVLGAASATAAWRPRVAWGYLAATVMLLFLVSWSISDASPLEIVFHDTVFNAFYATLCFAIAYATLRAGLLLDKTEDAAITEARHSAAVSGRTSEDARIQAFVHDSVLVALLAFSRGNTAHDAQAAHHARTALAALHRLHEGTEDATGAVTAREAVWMLQAAITDLNPETAFRSDLTDDEEQIPIEAVESLRDAAAEALRNSLFHAHSDPDAVARAVYVEAKPGLLRVEVFDDGRGFAPDRIPPARLGIATGIRGRMGSVPGGSSIIESSPGRGTRVGLRWDAP